MTEISAEKVRELREKTGAGMMDCKRALASVGGDMEKAIDHLRKEGVVKAAKKAGRATSEGLVGVSIGPDKKAAAIVEVNCETDFVARTDQFQNFINVLGEHIVKARPADLNALLAQKLGDGTVQDVVNQLVAKLGENMAVRRFRLLQAGGGEVLASYIHAGAKIGSVIRVKGAADEALVRDIAMHTAAMSPRFVDRAQVPAAVLDREKDVLKASPELAGKPENLVDKILQGKLNRFFSEVCLADQPFIKDTTGKKSVGDFLKEKAAGAQIVEMVRFQVGEEAAA
ncbi:MAG TPA: translation elongation factor Ts [bacterium]|nr:translation elongation factor Ts [bacterium]